MGAAPRGLGKQFEGPSSPPAAMALPPSTPVALQGVSPPATMALPPSTPVALQGVLCDQLTENWGLVFRGSA